jgi:pimeloyl-ACP methyl ester carboxylesterase
LDAASVREQDLAAGRVEGALLLNGVELAWRDRGSGAPTLFLHETAAGGAIWDPLIEAIGANARTIALDRRGWGASGAPEQYVATTIEEQAGDADALLRELDAGPAVACGAGLGAVVALELVLRHRDLVAAAVLIEPPLLAFLPEATEGIAADRQAITDAVAEGGTDAAVDSYLSGGLGHLGAGAERLPEALRAAARERPFSLFAELGAVPAWSLRASELGALDAASRIIVGGATPSLLRAAAERLEERLGLTELVDVGGTGLPHVGAAERVEEVLGSIRAAA